jgi:hypothetical protein
VDAEHFDLLTRALTSWGTRRRALVGLAGAIAGGTLAGLSLQEAAAGERLGGERCTKDRQCKSNKCLANGTCRCRNREPSVPCQRKSDVCRRGVCCTPCGNNCCRRGEFCADAATSTCVIREGSCRRGDDICAITESFTCGAFGGPINPDCACFTTMGGATRCGNSSGTNCGQCTTNQQCEDLGFGEGAFCARDTGAGCLCGQGQGFCARPCAG